MHMQNKPARKIKSSAVKNICKFPSTKSFSKPLSRGYQMVVVESILEKDYCFHLEADPNVKAYFPQPKTFAVKSRFLGNRNYTPDFEVHFRCGRKAFVEVKKSFESLDAAYLQKLELVSTEMHQYGYEFLWVDEVYIRQQPLLENLRKLQRFRKLLPGDHGMLTDLRCSIPYPQSLNDLVKNSLGISLESIYALIVDGLIAVDLSKEILTLDVEVAYERAR